MKRMVGLFSALVWLSSSIAASAADCSEILRYGIWEYNSSTAQLDSSQRFYQWWCNENSKQSKRTRDSSWGVSGSYADFRLGASGSGGRQSLDEFRQNFCGKVRKSENFSSREMQFARKASEDIVNAWSKCTLNGIGDGGELRGIRAWADYPSERTETNLVNFHFRFRSPFEDVNSGTVNISDIANLSCPVDIPLSKEVKDPEGFNIHCQRLSDEEAYLNFSVPKMASTPAGQIYLPKIMRIPQPREWVSDLADATCEVLPGGRRVSWRVRGSEIYADSPRVLTGYTSIYECDWRLPFRTNRVTLNIDGYVWKSGDGRGQFGEANGGLRRIRIYGNKRVGMGEPLQREVRSTENRPISKIERVGRTPLIADFNEPVDTVSVRFTLRDSWDSQRIRWTIYNPVLSVSPEGQMH